MNKYLLIDIATEHGNLQEIKRIHKQYNIKPSLYAKQIATISGHIDAVLYIENYIGVRNEIGINRVHKKYMPYSKLIDSNYIK